jgi:hypothetical protein
VKELTTGREDATGAKQEIPCGFAPLRLCVENLPARYAAPTALIPLDRKILKAQNSFNET